MAPWFLGSAAISAALAAFVPDLEQGFNQTSISKVRSNLLEIASASWELGTAAEATLELSWPSLSVFNSTAFPPPARLTPPAAPTDVLAIANKTVSAKPANSLALISNQSSAADPASIGVAVLLANWTRTNLSNHDYANAASGQLTYLLDDVPRSAEGAISHRADEVQLWADFVYMAPPFIAYYGALQGGVQGDTYLQTAYDQCRLYRDALRDESGLWRHITLGSFNDTTHWATGNGWAAAGMLRVLSTLNHTTHGRQFLGQQANLAQWINEILVASWEHQAADGALLNVIDDLTSFRDMSATALLASVTYRMAVFQNNTSLIGSANQALQIVKENVDADGWLQNVVDPITFHQPLLTSEHSPEGQAFVILLQAAWQAFSDFIAKTL
ncbi:Six-hairpin glycosidase-like protein [Flammula alnicola]|nr:Six-hairpin glycosidase-like protein [Flammula alnicola]